MDNNFENDRQSRENLHEPVAKKAEKPDATTYLILSIVGLALSTVLGIPLAGLIVSVIAMNKGKAYTELGGADVGEAHAARIMALLGLIFGIVNLAMVLVFLVFYFGSMFFVFGASFIAMLAGA